MINARNWLSDQTPVGNPQIVYQANGINDHNFEKFESGVSITIGFDATTHPKQLSWLKANTAETWKKILMVKTGLGAFVKNKDVFVSITVIDPDDNKTQEEFHGVEYFWPHQISKKPVKYSALVQTTENLYKKADLILKYHLA